MEYKDLSADDLSGHTDYDGHYKVRFFDDRETGLKACIALHNINLGPALGGCRFYDYASQEEAIRDVLRLSKGMTYKNALAGLPLGGGKSVILGNPAKIKTEALMEAMGRAVDTLGGDYISAEDSGTNEHDMAVMRRTTPHVMGLKAADESSVGGDPSPVTAYGVFSGMKAVLKQKYGSDAMNGLTFAVQGLGAVGYDLCRQLHEQGAKLIVTDVRDEVLARAAQQFGAQCVNPEDIFKAEANVFAPCALGAQVNERTIPQMKFDIIAGAANNQMATEADHARAADKGILYAPDYVINAGGVIAVAYEYLDQAGTNPFGHELTRANMMAHVEKIGATIGEIFKISEKCGITPGKAADEMAEAIFNGDGAREKTSGAA